MASLIRKKITTTHKGKKIRKESPYWYIRYKDAQGRWKDKRAYKDQTASMQLLAKIARKVELEQEGLFDRFEVHRKRPLTGHLDDFKQSMLNKGTTAQHAQQTYQRAQTVVEDCGFIFMGDIRPSKIDQILADKRTAGLSAQSSNFYLQAIKQFCNWMVLDQRSGDNPIQHMRGLNVKAHKRIERRALQPKEIDRLIAATVSGPKRSNMTGHERALLYLTALGTGLRAKELASLQWQSLDLKGTKPSITIKAGNSKHRQEDFLPIRPDLAALLDQWQNEQEAKPNDLVFPRFKKREGSRIIKRDLKAAKIPDKDENDQTLVFHSLRHTFVSGLARGGVHPKVAQMLARHSTITLTLDRYTHVALHDQRAALDVLPQLPSLEPKKGEENQVVYRKTGTDDQPVIETEKSPKKTHPKTADKLTQKLPQTAYPARQPRALAGSTKGFPGEGSRGFGPDHKSLPEKKMGVPGQPETPTVFTKKRRGRDSIDVFYATFLMNCVYSLSQVIPKT